MWARAGGRLSWAFLAVFLSLSAGAFAADKAATPGIIVVDVARAQRDTLAGRAIASQRNKYQQSFNAEFENTRKHLQQTQQELTKLKSTLAASAFDEKVKAFDEQVAGFQRRYQNAARALDKATAQASDELQRATIEATSDLAAEMGAGLVLHKQNVFLHDERMDVTDQIIERINKRLPNINFPVPEIDGEPISKAPAKGKK